jgi:hypothetical protein
MHFPGDAGQKAGIWSFYIFEQICFIGLRQYKAVQTLGVSLNKSVYADLY